MGPHSTPNPVVSGVLAQYAPLPIVLPFLSYFTGHVGFVIGRPWRHPKFAGVWLLRIADATTELHGDDSRPTGGQGGFGTATIAFLVDANGAPRAYGWYGEAQDPATYVPTDIVLGRVFR